MEIHLMIHKKIQVNLLFVIYVVKLVVIIIGKINNVRYRYVIHVEFNYNKLEIK
jgi:hypothetical protein